MSTRTRTHTRSSCARWKKIFAYYKLKSPKPYKHGGMTQTMVKNSLLNGDPRLMGLPYYRVRRSFLFVAQSYSAICSVQASGSSSNLSNGNKSNASLRISTSELPDPMSPQARHSYFPSSMAERTPSQDSLAGPQVCVIVYVCVACVACAWGRCVSLWFCVASVRVHLYVFVTRVLSCLHICVPVCECVWRAFICSCACM